jgi:hypothetical protein
MCRSRSSLIGGAKKGHGKISWPNPIGKHIQVLQQNPPNNGREDDSPSWLLRANSKKGRPEKGAASPWGRTGRARTRSGDGEGWGRDRAREAPKNDVINGT